MKSTTHGFSLIELMVTLSVAAIVLAIGAPSFQQFRLNNRLSNAANDLLGVITVARTEAIKRQRNVAACRTANPGSDTATCSPGSTAGWIVFDDADGNCTRTNGPAEPLISSREFDDTIPANALRVQTDGDCLQFGPSGFRQAVAGTVSISHVALCDNRGMQAQDGVGMSAGRGILITSTGRARITRVVGGGLADDVTGAAWAGVKCPA